MIKIFFLILHKLYESWYSLNFAFPIQHISEILNGKLQKDNARIFKPKSDTRNPF